MNRATIPVIAFGRLTDVVPESSRIDLELPIAPGSIRDELVARFPELAKATFRVAVDQRFPRDDERLTSIEEIALFPPFAGG